MSILSQRPKGAIKMYPEKVKLHYLDGRPEKYRLHEVKQRPIKEKDVIAYASQVACVPKSALIMAQGALFDAIKYFCVNGHAVQVPYLGTFSVQLNCEVTETAVEANEYSVKQRRIRFFPKAELKNMCSRDNIRIDIEDILGLKK